MRTDDLDPLRLALRRHREGRAVALATVMETWGSAPRRPGSFMMVDDEGRFAGSVSGGCVEVAVAEEARGVLADGLPRSPEYGVADDDAWAVGLACGGRITVRIVPVGEGGVGVSPDLLEAALAVREGGPPLAWAFDLGAGGVGDAGRAGLPDDAVAAALADDTSRVVEGPRGPVFLRPFNPAPRILLVGAVHIAQPLAALAAVVGFDTVVIDPREAFARPERFPGVRLIGRWPAEGLAEAGMDARTAVVALTHDPKLDDPAIQAALAGPAFYVGALGSRRTHAGRLDRLREAGVPETSLGRIHAPVGLDLGGRAPEEVALSVLAEIVAVLRGGSAARRA